MFSYNGRNGHIYCQLCEIIGIFRGLRFTGGGGGGGGANIMRSYWNIPIVSGPCAVKRTCKGAYYMGAVDT